MKVAAAVQAGLADRLDAERFELRADRQRLRALEQAHRVELQQADELYRRRILRLERQNADLTLRLELTEDRLARARQINDGLRNAVAFANKRSLS